MTVRSSLAVSLLVLSMLLAAPVVRAENPVVEAAVPALNDGTRIALGDVERAILAACESSQLRATVVAPGLISARSSRLWKSFEITIPYSEAAYSIRFKKVRRMDHDAAGERIDGLSADIDASLGDALKRLKSLQKPMRKSKRISPRTAV
jgi:hypothetical protein